MNFDLNLILGFSSQNPEENKAANQFLSENILNPDLTVFIFAQLSNPDVLADHSIVRNLCLILFQIIKNVWNVRNSGDEQTGQLLSQIRANILQICISICSQFPESSDSLGDSLKLIIDKEDIESQDLITALCSVINPEMTPQGFPLLSLVFQCLFHFSQVVSRPQKDEVNRCEPFAQTFLQIIDLVLPKLGEFFSNVPDNHALKNSAYMISKCIAGILGRIIMNSEESLQKEEIPAIVNFLIQLLVIEDQSKESIFMKASILDTFGSIVTSSNKEERSQFVMPIAELILSQFPTFYQPLFQTIIQSECTNALSKFMYFVYIMYNNGISLEWIQTQAFVFEFLIPASKLTASDLEEFETSPSHYFAQNYSVETSLNDYEIPRSICSLIASQLRQDHPELLITDITQIADPYLLESYLFLLFQAYLTDDENVFMPPELYAQIISLLNGSEVPPPLLATAICALRNNIILHDSDCLQQIAAAAYQIIMTSGDNYLLAMCAISLFRTTIESLYEQNLFEQLVNLNDFLTRLFQVSQEISSNEVPLIIQLISKNSPSDILQSSLAMFQMYCEKVSYLSSLPDIDEEQETELDDTIETLTNLFEIQPEGSEQKLELGKQIINLAIHILTECPDSPSLHTVLKIPGYVASRLKFTAEVPELVESAFNLLQLICQCLQENEDFIYMIKYILGFFTNIMPYLNPEMVELIKTVCLSIIGNPEGLEDDSRIALIILADIIEVHGYQIEEILQLAIGLIQSHSEEISYVILGCINILTSALYKTNGECSSVIPQEVISYWIENSDITVVRSDRDIHIFSLGLLYLYSKGLEATLPAVGNLLFQKFESNQKNEEDDFDIDEFEFPENTILPSDSVNVSKMFLQYATAAGILDQYDQQFIADLQKKASEEDTQ